MKDELQLTDEAFELAWQNITGDEYAAYQFAWLNMTGDEYAAYQLLESVLEAKKFASPHPLTQE